MARLYADENFPGPTAERLRQLGHDVLTARQAGQADQQISDELVLAFAVDQRRALLTMNRRDFIRIHGLRPEHAGIIVCTEDRDFVGLAERVHRTIANAGDLAGRLIRVVRPS